MKYTILLFLIAFIGCKTAQISPPGFYEKIVKEKSVLMIFLKEKV